MEVIWGIPVHWGECRSVVLLAVAPVPDRFPRGQRGAS
jgi:hypothetical protein